MTIITKRVTAIAGIAALIVAAAPDPAYAMHISDGVLPAGWAVFWWALAAPLVAWSAKALEAKNGGVSEKPFVGLVGSAVFIISLMPIPVPVAGSCSHPCGVGLAALLIGPRRVVAISAVALALQAVFLAHGGLTTLGANIMSMGVAGALAGYATFTVARKLGAPAVAGAFMAGLVSDWATYSFTSLELASGLTIDGSILPMFGAIMAAFSPTQIPLGILEGFVTAGAYRFVMERRPELLPAMRGAGERA